MYILAYPSKTNKPRSRYERISTLCMYVSENHKVTGVALELLLDMTNSTKGH